tara:strand:+ start:51 stop:512 length:462 start_codon:yes stop_codon:yes gene_type:complete
MATVPGSGTTLSMKSMAQEALHGTYGSGTIVNPISLYDMTNGGQVNGSGDDYPVVNQDCLPNPANRSSLTLPNMGSATFSGTLYYNSSIGDAENLTVGNYIYTDSALTTTTSSGSYGQSMLTGSQYVCSTMGGSLIMVVDSSGIITSIECEPV